MGKHERWLVEEACESLGEYSSSGVSLSSQKVMSIFYQFIASILLVAWLNATVVIVIIINMYPLVTELTIPKMHISLHLAETITYPTVERGVKLTIWIFHRFDGLISGTT